MRSTLVLVTLCLGLATMTAAAQEPKVPEKAVALGEKVFTAQKCILCHSIGAKGNTKGPLDAAGSTLSAAEIRQWIVDAPGMTAKAKSTRKPAMKAYTLPKDDVDALVAYMMTLKTPKK